MWLCFALCKTSWWKVKVYPRYSYEYSEFYLIWSYKGLGLNEVLCIKLPSISKDLLLTHWARVTHICISKLTIIGSDNGLSPSWRQAIIWTNAGILLIRPLGTNFSEILIAISAFSCKKMHLKVPSVKWRPFCLGLNVLICTAITAEKVEVVCVVPRLISDLSCMISFT